MLLKHHLNFLNYMPNKEGGYDKPYYSGSKVMGRNKELTNDWTLLTQAHEEIATTRKDTNSGKLKPGNYKTEKVVTPIPRSNDTVVI